MKRKLISEIISDFKWLVTFLWLSVFAITKFSKAPIWFDFLLPVLRCPNEGTLQYEIWRILENLSLAYIAALIFYVMVTYIPEKKCELRAFDLTKKRIQYLYSTMDDVLAYFKYTCSVEIFLVLILKK